MGSTDGQSHSGVLGRLQAREAQRAAEAAKRLQTLQSSADPRESIEGFMGAFASQRQALEAALQSLLAGEALGGGGGGAAGGGAAAVDGLAADILELDKEIAAAAYYLPTYDLRQATLGITALKEQLEAAKAALQPRKKFSFSRKAAPAKAQPSPPGGAGEAAAAVCSSSGGEGAGGSNSLQQLLGTSGAPGTSGRSISGLRGEVVVEARQNVAGLDVTLSDLQDCTVFLPGPLAALFIHRLQRCRVYAGPVAGATFMEDVRDSTLVLASRQVRIHSTHACDIYLRVLSNPIIEFSAGVRFAPYALAYPGVEEDLAQQGLQEETGKWVEVHDFGWLRASKSPNWEVLPEDQRQPPPEVPGQRQGQAAGSPQQLEQLDAAAAQLQL